MKQKKLMYGILACIGGFLVHIVIGSIYNWLIINPFIATYYKINQAFLQIEGTPVVFSCLIVCIALSIKLGVELSQKIGSLVILIGCQLCAALCILLSSFVKSYINFIILYGVIFSFLVGMTFQIPLIQCNKYIKGKNHYVNGFIMIGNALGPFIFGQFTSNYLNPQNLNSYLGYYQGDSQYLLQNVPNLIRYLSLIYVIFGISGTLLMIPVIRHNKQQQSALQQHNQNQNQNQKELGCPSITVALNSQITYMIGIVFILGLCGNILINQNFKTYPQNKVVFSDRYFYVLAGIASLMNGTFRIVWNIIFIKIGFRLFYLILMITNILYFCIIQFAVKSQVGYFLIIILININYGGIVGTFPSIIQNKFGQKTGQDLFGTYIFCFALSGFMEYGIAYGLSLKINWDQLFYIPSAMCLIVIILITIYPFEEVWNKKQKKSTNSLYSQHTVAKLEINPSKHEGVSQHFHTNGDLHPIDMIVVY